MLLLVGAAQRFRRVLDQNQFEFPANLNQRVQIDRMAESVDGNDGDNTPASDFVAAFAVFDFGDIRMVKRKICRIQA